MEKRNAKKPTPYLGAAYYPEVWDESEIDKDIEKMKYAGLNCVRIAEFAWGNMEPREGEFGFKWLHNVVEKLYKAEIAVIMCTPSATPPKWLTDKYPETLLMSDNGMRKQFGGRCHVCKTSSVMREKNRIIVKKMCEEFARHPAVIGWQIDNEIYPYEIGCFCPLCKEKFTKFLEKKYVTVGNLNKCWGTARWSQQYALFKDVIPPRKDTWNHPSLCVEWWRFQSENIAEYVDEQAGIIKRYFDVPVGTDMMTTLEQDYYRTNKNLDVVQFNHYETAEELYKASFWFDYVRCIKDRPFWNTETQTCWVGATSSCYGHRPAGNCYVNSWLPVAKGAEMNLYWPWRTHPHGHELAHSGVVTSAGRYYHIIDEVKKVSEEFKKCADFLNTTRVNSDIAIHFGTESHYNYICAPLVEDYHHIFALMRVKEAFNHYNADVINLESPLDKYKVILSPYLSSATGYNFPERILKWVEDGGTWIAGPMTDIMTDYAAKYTSAPYSFLEEAAGIYTKYQITVASDTYKAEWNDGSPLKISTYYDAYELRGAESLAKYTTESLNGLNAITVKHRGKGKIIAVGTFIYGKDLVKLAGMKPIFEASDNIELVERSGGQSGVIALEQHNKDGYVMLDGEYLNLIDNKKYSGKVNIKPHEVAVFRRADK